MFWTIAALWTIAVILIVLWTNGVFARASAENFDPNPELDRDHPRGDARTST